MNTLTIETFNNKTVYLPGEKISGKAKWNITGNSKKIELKLFWYTVGKGTMDLSVVDSMVLENPLSSGSRDFSFTLPEIPFSFSGKLISVIWALELIAQGFNETGCLELTVSPSGKEITV